MCRCGMLDAPSTPNLVATKRFVVSSSPWKNEDGASFQSKGPGCLAFANGDKPLRLCVVR